MDLLRLPRAIIFGESVAATGMAGRMKLLMFEDSVRLSQNEAIVIVLVVLCIWIMGYTTGAEVTRMCEKTTVLHCIFTPAPEDSSRV